MLNYYELLNLINTDEMTSNEKNIVSAIRDDFRNDFADNCKNIKSTAYTVKQGIDAFIKHCKFKDETIKGLYCTDCQILSVTAACNDDGVKTNNLSNLVKPFLDSNKTPCDLYLKESLAVAKSLGYKYGDKDYMVEVDGNFYAMDRLYEVFRCLGSDCEYGELLTSDYYKKGRQPLMIKGKNSFAIVLPVIRTAIDKKYDCTFNHYIDNERDLDDKIYKRSIISA